MRPAHSKLFFCVLATALLAGCGAPGIPIPPSLELAKPVTDLRAVRKGDKVYLAWTVPVETTERRTIRRSGATRICRNLGDAMKECGTPAIEIPPTTAAQTKSAPLKKDVSSAPRVTASYVDVLSADLQAHATSQVSYAVEVVNESKRGAGLSNQVQVPAAAVLSPPANFQAQVTSEGVVLSWTGVQPPSEIAGLRYVYRVYRHQKIGGKNALAGELPVEDATAPRMIDLSFEWEQTYLYRATVVTLIAQEGRPELQVEGADTPTITVVARDVFPPAVPSGLQAVFSGVGQSSFVDLVWAPDTDTDLAGYNIFRREENTQPVKINADLVKSPSYRDTNVQNGKTYYYSVTALDVRSNESSRSDEANEAVP